MYVHKKTDQGCIKVFDTFILNDSLPMMLK